MLTAASAVLARGVASLVSFMTVPLLLRHLTAEEFGLWMTLTSVLGLLSFADFGIGNGLLNHVAERSCGTDLAEVRKATTNALMFVSAAAGSVLILYFTWGRWLPWADYFNVRTTDGNAVLDRAITATVLCFAIGLPASLVQKVQLARQEGYIAQGWSVLGSLLTLAAFFGCLYGSLGLPWMLTAVLGMPVLASGLNTLHYFRFLRKEIRPRLSDFNVAMLERLGKLGCWFFLLQLAVLLGFWIDNIVITRTLGLQSVATYNVYYKLFQLIPMVHMLWITPLWPAYTEAVTKREHEWTKKTIKRSMILATSTTTAVSLVLLLKLPEVLGLWAGAKYSADYDVAIPMAVWAVMFAAASAWGTFLNAAGLIRPQLLLAFLFAVVGLFAKIYGAERWGVAGVAWATVISYGGIGLPLHLLIARRNVWGELFSMAPTRTEAEGVGV
ncbi:MAG: oligosaccharide flippase family protein [Acidobacteria bacterium]|nr:oligosaccharide flippase family protein [Acidobacteriota bacterium]